MKNADFAAFPFLETGSHNSEFGLTKREFFAAMAMQGILAGIPQRAQDMIPLLEYYAKEFPDKKLNECVAIESIELADKLLEGLELQSKPK